MRFAQMAVRVWGCEMNFADPMATAKEGIACFRRFLHDIGLPINLAELGAKVEDIPALVCNQGLNGGKTGGFLALDEAAITEIYHIAANAHV